MIKTIDKSYKPSPEYPYFYYDPEGDPEGDGFVYFKTELIRDEYANVAIQGYLHDGWDDQVVNVVSGTLTGSASMINVEIKPDSIDDEGCDSEGYYWPNECDYRCDYKLMPLGSVCLSTKLLKY